MVRRQRQAGVFQDSRTQPAVPWMASRWVRLAPHRMLLTPREDQPLCLVVKERKTRVPQDHSVLVQTVQEILPLFLFLGQNGGCSLPLVQRSSQSSWVTAEVTNPALLAEAWPEGEDLHCLMGRKADHSPSATVTLRVFYNVCFTVSIVFNLQK